MPINKLESVTGAGAASQGGCCGDAPATGGTAAADRCCDTKSACCEPASDCCDVKIDPDEEDGGAARTLPAFVNGSPAVSSPADVPVWSPIESEEERRKRIQAQQQLA